MPTARVYSEINPVRFGGSRRERTDKVSLRSVFSIRRDIKSIIGYERGRVGVLRMFRIA